MISEKYRRSAAVGGALAVLLLGAPMAVITRTACRDPSGQLDVTWGLEGDLVLDVEDGFCSGHFLGQWLLMRATGNDPDAKS